MRTFLALFLKIIGGMLVFIGSVFGIAPFIGSVDNFRGKSAQGIADWIALGITCAIFWLISYFLIRLGSRTIRRGKDLTLQEIIEKADEAARHEELRKLQHEETLVIQREEAQIQQQRLELERVELQRKLAEQERLQAIEQENERQRLLEEEKRKANEEVFLTDEQIEKLEQNIELPNLDDCELMLQRNEIAVYGSKASWIPAKSMGFYSGHLYITNQRVGFVSEEKGFVLSHDDIIAVGNKPDGIVLQLEKSAYGLKLPRTDLAYKVFHALRKHIPIEGVSETSMNETASKAVVSADVSMVDGMDGHSFEYYCADLLEKNGFGNVEVTKGSGDQGVDIIAVKDGIKYAIQCKNYASKLGNTPIQEVSAGRLFYSCHVGVVMTNSTFTPAAEELAASTNVLLWDREVLDGFIKKAFEHA